MSEQGSSSQGRESLWRLWLDAGVVWLGLLALFALNVFLAFLTLGSANVAVHMSIAIVMIVILVLFFMDFKEYTALLRLAAVAGVFWLVFMFVLTASDYLTRQ
jgi:cytochrome c oxidase subunit IV